MDKTLNSIKEISIKLIDVIEASQSLERLANNIYASSEDIYLKEIEEIVDHIEQKESKKRQDVKVLLEELDGLTKLYLALTTPYSNPYSVEEDQDDNELEKELSELYQDYKELVKIGPDPRQGWDRSYQAELSRLEDTIDHLEAVISEIESE